MMNGSAQALWESKLSHGRHLRKDAYEHELEALNAQGILNSGAMPTALYAVVVKHIEELVIAWRQIFSDYWRRENPMTPNEVGEKAKKEIEDFIRAERASADRDVQDICEQRFHRIGNDLQQGRDAINRQTEIWVAGCHSDIDFLVSIRVAELEKERVERIEKRYDRAWTIISSGIVAVVAAFIGAWANARFAAKDNDLIRFEQRQQAISQERISSELAEMRKSYHDLVVWTLKSPAQIDREIVRIQDDLRNQIVQIKEDYRVKKDNADGNFAQRGIFQSGIRDQTQKQLDAEQAQAIKDAETIAQRRIEDLREQKRKVGLK